MLENWWQSEIHIAINDKSQVSIAKNLSFDGFLHYKFIIQLDGERVFKINEYLAKLQAKWLIISFALHFCPQRCRTHQISKITCVIQTETVTSCCYVNRQINVSVLSQISNYCRPFFMYFLTDRLTPSVTNRLLIMYGILVQHLCYSSCVQSFVGFFLWLM